MECSGTYYRLLELIRDRLIDLGYLCRFMGLLRMAMMHTKLIKIKNGVFWDILQAAGVDQGQVNRPGVPLQVHGAAPNGHDAHETDQDKVGSVLGHNTGC
jgi:hypothetical protein